MRKEVPLSDKSYFKLFIGKRALYVDLFGKKAEIPLYSANVSTPFGYVSESNVDDFSKDYVLWGIDGDFAFSVVPKGEKFATTDHCGAIAILTTAILPHFLIAQLEAQGHILGFDRGLRASLTNMRRVNVKIPFLDDGTPDVAMQSELAKKYVAVRRLKDRVAQEAEELSQVVVELPRAGDFETILLEDLFDLTQTTNRSDLTKRFVNEHPGPIPVYSASGDFDEAGYGYLADNLEGVKYFEDALTWNIDGSRFRAFFRAGRFSLSEKVIPLILKDEWKGIVDYHYVKFVIDVRAVESGAAYQNKPGKGRIKSLGIDIPMTTIKGKRTPDLARQHELAKQYELVASAQEDVVAALRELTVPTVDF